MALYKKEQPESVDRQNLAKVAAHAVEELLRSSVLPEGTDRTAYTAVKMRLEDTDEHVRLQALQSLALLTEEKCKIHPRILDYVRTSELVVLRLSTDCSPQLDFEVTPSFDFKVGSPRSFTGSNPFQRDAQVVFIETPRVPDGACTPRLESPMYILTTPRPGRYGGDTPRFGREESFAEYEMNLGDVWADLFIDEELPSLPVPASAHLRLVTTPPSLRKDPRRCSMPRKRP
jgi:hypothetical protein